MKISQTWTRLALASGAALLASACTSGAQPPPELTAQQVCLAHHANNQMEQDRCKLSADASHGPVPDARAQDLPIKSGQISD